MINKSTLQKLYGEKKYSSVQIAKERGCSPGQVNYWLSKYCIKKRSISDAVYEKSNPGGDPFSLLKVRSKEEWFLYGLGLGLYWGEGNKANRLAVRLGNTDPGLVRTFLRFLSTIYRVDTSRLRFGLQIFSDLDPVEAKAFWSKELGVSATQFQKTATVSRIRRGTYTHKAAHGVLTVYFSNTKLRATIMAAIEKLQKQQNSTLPM
ncbi:hypothetical protein K2Q16_02360 [Patescibacteria group bacterium]|nr:hypothetical protein [Patescibacteria group bacterium]